jgi:hypothetical protein
MPANWDFYLLLLAVVAWALFKARAVWRRERERREELRGELEAFEREEAARRDGAHQGADEDR